MNSSNKNKNNKNKLIAPGALFVGFWLLVMLPVIWIGCEEEGRRDLYDINAPAPAPVSNVTARYTPGGAVIKYTLPDDPNLRHVRAEYEIRPGLIRETSASRFVDSLVLEGFGDTQTYTVRVYSVGRNEKVSEPRLVQIIPEEAPIHQASVKLEATFDGVRVRLHNPQRTNLAIELMGDTGRIKLGVHVGLQTFYSNMENATFSLRGLDTISSDFSVYMRDRWGNVTEPEYETLKPLFSEIIPKPWAEVNLPNDAYMPLQGQEGYKPYNMWDGNYTTPWIAYAARDDYDMPQWITWDLKVTAVLNRFKIWHHPTDTRIYGYNSPKIFELWGAREITSRDGSWDQSWIPLGTYITLPPSGFEQPTAEDLQFARNGIECDIEENEFAPDPFVPVRYLRFKTIETFYGPRLQDGVWIKQLDFWGTIEEFHD